MAVYGVTWTTNNSNPTTSIARTQSNIGKTAGASFDAIGPWATRRCNLWPDGTPTAYYGDRCYTDTDIINMGQCMVRIPKFWYNIDGSDIANNRVGFYISTTGADTGIRNLANTADLTWAVHPAFYVVPAAGGAAVEKDYVYVGAYHAYHNVDVYESKAGVLPTLTETAAQARTHTQAQGTGWELETIQIASALRLLYLIEYASLNSQSALSEGYAHAAALANTGATTTLGNASGQVLVTGDDYMMSYRGVEAMWGNAYTLLEGINIGSPADYQAWIAPQTHNRADATGKYACNRFDLPYVDTTLIMPSGAGYVVSIATDPATCVGGAWAFLPASSTGGSTTTYFCDRYAPSAASKIVATGGLFNDPTGYGGAFRFVMTTYTPTGPYSSRIAYLP